VHSVASPGNKVSGTQHEFLLGI